MKRVLKMVPMILVSLFVSFYGFSAEKKSNAPLNASTKGSISIWLGYGETAAVYEAAKKKFNQKYPNIQVGILTFTLREFESKLASSMPTGLGPDLVVLHDFIFERYYSNGYLEPLSPDQAAIVGNSGKIDPVYASLNKRGGKYYAVPYWTGKRCLFYNKDHFKAAGLTRPPATMEELWSYAEKLAKKDSSGAMTRAGITLRLTGPTGGTQKFSDFFYQETGKQMLEEGKKPGTVKVMIKPNLDAAAKVLHDHIAHLHGSLKVDDWSLKHDAESFTAGISSMLLRETWVIKQVEKNNPSLNFDTAPVPKSKYSGAYNYVESLAVNKDSKFKEATWEFIRILQEQSMLDVLINESGYQPLRKDRNFSAFLAKNPKYKPLIQQPHPSYKNYFEPTNLAYEEVTTRMGEIIQKAFLDKSLLNNKDGCKNVMLKVHEKAEQILKEQQILSD